MEYLRLQKLLLTIVLIFHCFNSHGVQAKTSPELEIHVGKPKFVLPQFSGPYREREASIAPEEYEQAEMLKSLLDEDNKQAVLKELEGFYDIELSPAMQTLKAQVYFSLKMYNEAESTYLSVLERKPQFIRAHADLAQLYLLTEKPVLARKHFAKAIEYGANEAIIHGQLGYLNLTHYGPFSAISEYQIAMALEPENTQWQQGLLVALLRAQMFDAATALLDELISLNPEKIDLWLNKATLLLKQEKAVEALSCLEMAMLLGDKNVNNLRVAAQLHLTHQSYGRAIELIERHIASLQMDPDLFNSYLSQLKASGQWNHAKELLEKFENNTKHFDNNEKSRLFLNKAAIYQALNKPKEALGYYESAIELDPLNGQAILEYAHFSLFRKAYPKAELLYIRAESIKDVEKNAMLGRSQLYLELQDYHAALKHLREVKAKFPELVGLSDKIEIIENIVKSKQASI